MFLLPADATDQYLKHAQCTLIYEHMYWISFMVCELNNDNMDLVYPVTRCHYRRKKVL